MESERNYSERVTFYKTDFKRQEFWTRVACVGALGITGGLAWLLTTETAAALGLCLSLSLMGVATYLSTRA